MNNMPVAFVSDLLSKRTVSLVNADWCAKLKQSALISSR